LLSNAIQKVLRKFAILRKWFQPSTDVLIDEFLNFDPLRWKEYVKELHKYVQGRRKRAHDEEKNNITSINFPIEGVSIHLKKLKIVHYLF
jgi:hypothetical protein